MFLFGWNDVSIIIYHLIEGEQMILVIGGAYSGKTHFIKEQFNLSDDDFIYGDAVTDENICHYRAIADFNKYILPIVTESLTDNNIEELVIDKVTKLLHINNDIIVEMREVGSGIVPIEKKERLFREVIGRVSCSLAEQSEEVFRVVCGIPVKLK